MTDLGETPSDGFKIETGVWGVLRASENSASKILRISKPFSNIHESYLLQNFSLANPSCTELKCMELNWSFISQNSIINQVTFKRWKFTRKQAHIIHVVFLKTCPLWKCTKIAMTKESNKMILFFCLSVSNQQRINEKSVVLFSYGEKMSII